jgi:ubiquinone/menaquinone biosynthesis C-methylase UbiE
MGKIKRYSTLLLDSSGKLSYIDVSKYTKWNKNMSKDGEINYLKKLHPITIEHAMNKPWSDEFCGDYLLELGAIINLLPKPPKKLLDLGCGTGWTSCFFAKSGFVVTGQDISSDMVECANKNREKEHLENLEFTVCDYEQMQYDSEFDCAVFYDSLHHSENMEMALKMVWKALKPGGICITCEPGKGHAQSEISQQVVEEYDTTEQDMPPNKVIKIGKKVGFTTFKVYPRIIHLTKVMYGTPKGKLVNLIFKTPLLKQVAFLFLLLFSKKNHGMVVLEK